MARDLKEFKAFMNFLGSPEDSFKSVHVAGTNGKGSTSAMLSWVLTCAGYKTGLFTSPHLVKPNERIRIDGEDISDEDYSRLEAFVRTKSEEYGIELIGFEEYTAIGFLYFAEQKPDIAVIEVGLGGRLDPTNIITSPELSVITQIDLDHTDILGSTIAEIAGQKAGIIKPGSTAVCMAQNKEAERAFISEARACRSDIAFTDPPQLKVNEKCLDYQILDYRWRTGLKLSLLGEYQKYNAALVLDCIDRITDLGYKIPDESIRTGFQTVSWPGRFEVLQKEPLIIVDGAHNPNGVEALVRCLNAYLPGRKIHFVMGVLADKDYERMLALISPLAESFTLETPPSSRALPKEDLMSLISASCNVPVECADTVEEAVRSACKNQRKDEVVCVFGSLYQVGAVRAVFGK